jgi:hypothetical protein
MLLSFGEIGKFVIISNLQQISFLAQGAIRLILVLLLKKRIEEQSVIVY